MHSPNNRHRGTCSAGTAGGWDPGVVEVFPSCNDHGTLRLSGSGAPPHAARRGRSAPTAAALRAGRAAPGGRGASARCWAAGRASAEREPPSLFPRRVRAGGAAAAAQGRSVCAALACSLPPPSAEPSRRGRAAPPRSAALPPALSGLGCPARSCAAWWPCAGLLSRQRFSITCFSFSFPSRWEAFSGSALGAVRPSSALGRRRWRWESGGRVGARSASGAPKQPCAPRRFLFSSPRNS